MGGMGLGWVVGGLPGNPWPVPFQRKANFDLLG